MNAVLHLGDDGVARSLTLADLPSVRGTGLTWVRLEQMQGVAAVSAPILDLRPEVERALLAVETRPRCELFGEGVLLNLRAPTAVPDDDGDVLASLRLWAEAGLVVTFAFRPALALVDVEHAFMRGELDDPGDIIITLISRTAGQLDPIVADIGDALDELESNVGPDMPFSERRRVTRFRSQAISYRRFVVPQRQALDRLATVRLPWLDEHEQAEVREAADRFARMGEELEAVRERAAILHEELTDLRAERIDERSLLISVVALIFLPLTFITGLLGMNVSGIPFAQAPWAFWGVTGVCLAIAVGVASWFSWKRWVSR